MNSREHVEKCVCTCVQKKSWASAINARGKGSKTPGREGLDLESPNHQNTTAPHAGSKDDGVTEAKSSRCILTFSPAKHSLSCLEEDEASKAALAGHVGKTPFQFGGGGGSRIPSVRTTGRCRRGI